MTRPPLTFTQAEVLGFLIAYQAENQTPPTAVETQEKFGWRSRNAAEDHLKALVRKGYITRRSGKARGIFIVPKE